MKIFIIAVVAFLAVAQIASAEEVCGKVSGIQITSDYFLFNVTSETDGKIIKIYSINDTQSDALHNLVSNAYITSTRVCAGYWTDGGKYIPMFQSITVGSGPFAK